MVDSFIRQFTDEDLGDIIEIKRRYFLVNDTLKRANVQDPAYIGIYLGERKGSFRPSPALLELIAEKSGKKLFVDKKGEWLFLCARDLFGRSILRSNVKQGLVLVQNEQDQNLGYGKIINSLEKKDQVVVKNLLDRGAYLRDEGQHRNKQ